MHQHDLRAPDLRPHSPNKRMDAPSRHAAAARARGRRGTSGRAGAERTERTDLLSELFVCDHGDSRVAALDGGGE